MAIDTVTEELLNSSENTTNWCEWCENCPAACDMDCENKCECGHSHEDESDMQPAWP